MTSTPASPSSRCATRSVVLRWKRPVRGRRTTSSRPPSRRRDERPLPSLPRGFGRAPSERARPRLHAPRATGPPARGGRGDPWGADTRSGGHRSGARRSALGGGVGRDPRARRRRDVIYLYALSDPLTEAPTAPGLDGAPLRVVTTESLAAVVSDWDRVPLAADERALWAHERVVEELMLQQPVLPMRFGSILHDDAAARSLLVARQEELMIALRRVTGAVELGVRVAWQAEETSSQKTSPNAPLSAAYLVDEDHVDAFRARIATLGRDIGDADIVCTGPWPPYSFTGGQAS